MEGYTSLEEMQNDLFSLEGKTDNTQEKTEAAVNKAAKILEKEGVNFFIVASSGKDICASKGRDFGDKSSAPYASRKAYDTWAKKNKPKSSEDDKTKK